MVASREIGWSTEANLYWQISKQLDRIIQLGALLNPLPPIPDNAITTKDGLDYIKTKDELEYITEKITI